MRQCRGGCNQGRKPCDSEECSEPLSRGDAVVIVIVEAVSLAAFIACVCFISAGIGSYVSGGSLW